MSVASFRFLLLKLSIVLGTIARPSGRGVPSRDTQTLLCVCLCVLLSAMIFIAFMVRIHDPDNRKPANR